MATPILPANSFCGYTDKLAAAYLALLGSSGSGFGCGDGDPTLGNDWGFSRKMRDYENDILGSNNRYLIQSLGSNSARAADNAPASQLVYALMYPLLYDIDRYCAKLGLTAVTGMVSYMTYYNTGGVGGPWNALVAPEFAALYSIVYPGVALAPTNVYAPAIANMGQRSFGGAFAAGTAVDSTQYAGAVEANAIVSSSTWSSPGQIIVTGTARASDGSTQTARTWTTPNESADGTYTLTPNIAGDILLQATGITLPGSLTAGTVIVAGLVPLGRTSPPA